METFREYHKFISLNRYHYANNQRIENILLDTSIDTRVVTDSQKECGKADHGYNNLEKLMQVCHCVSDSVEKRMN